MAVTVRIGESTATCTNYEWTSKDKQLAKDLTALLEPLGPAGSDPWPDYTAALTAINRYGGKIIGSSNPPKTVPGRIY